MNVAFLTIGSFNSIEDHSIYTDLLRTFRDNGHDVYVVCANEKREGKPTEFLHESGIHLLRVKIGNITKCGLIEKGISTVLLESQYIKAIKKYLSNTRFDLILYSTPPITFFKAVSFVKKRDGTKSYLLLKDIFPQNAVDLGMMSKTGVKGFLYRYFRNKEKSLYALSDKIGCMSQANVDYILKHNSEIPAEKVVICPNSIEVQKLRLTPREKEEVREKYGIPVNKKVFVYGGNLGKPQGIPFIIECLKSQESQEDVFFLIVGDGTEYGKLETYFNTANPKNMKLMKRLPKDDYDRMITACDVGMIFLDYRFTIPNFPSRLLSYMQAGIPVLACTDPNTDIGKVITEGGFGWWCESNDVVAFNATIQEILASDVLSAGNAGFDYLNKHYTVEKGFRAIMGIPETDVL